MRPLLLSKSRPPQIYGSICLLETLPGMGRWGPVPDQTWSQVRLSSGGPSTSPQVAEDEKGLNRLGFSGRGHQNKRGLPFHWSEDGHPGSPRYGEASDASTICHVQGCSLHQIPPQFLEGGHPMIAIHQHLPHNQYRCLLAILGNRRCSSADTALVHDPKSCVTLHQMAHFQFHGAML